MRSDLVRLTSEESYCAKFIANVRTSESRRMGISDRSATALMKRGGLFWDELGACGEVACAKWLNIKYDATVNTFHHCRDVGPFEIRTASRDTDRLILRDSDKELSDKPFILIVKRASCLYRVVGWSYAEGLFEEEYLSNFGIEDREPGYAIPQSYLNTDFSCFEDELNKLERPFKIDMSEDTFSRYKEFEIEYRKK
jgi:hypothetical protein